MANRGTKKLLVERGFGIKLDLPGGRWFFSSPKFWADESYADKRARQMVEECGGKAVVVPVEIREVAGKKRGK